MLAAFVCKWIGAPDALILALLGVLVIAIVVTVWQGLRSRHVIRERAVAAESLHWKRAESLPEYADAFPGFPFNQGRNREAQMVAFGPSAATFGAIFTLQFTRGSGRFAHVQHYDVVLVELIHRLPEAYIYPNDSVESAKMFAGMDRSTFELAHFNDAWSVTGPDKRFVHGLVHQQLIEVFQTFEIRTPICIANGAIYAWTAKRLTAKQSVDVFLQLLRVRRSIPMYLWEDFGWAGNPRLNAIYGRDLDAYHPETGQR